MSTPAAPLAAAGKRGGRSDELRALWRETALPAVRHHLAAISQTFFLHHARAGLALVVALVALSPAYALSALVASVVARLTASRLGAPQALLTGGLVELNGWFAGLAAAMFWAPSPGLAVMGGLAGVLSAAAVLGLERWLATWDLPLLVAPYVLVFWVLWPAFSLLADSQWLPRDTWPALPAAASTGELVVLGGLRGVGQIFFCPDVTAGLAIAAAVAVVKPRLALALIVASTAGVAVGQAIGAPLWAVEQGLFGFSAALMAAAAASRYRGFGWGAVAVAVLIGPWVELAAIKMAGALGLYALSASYVALVWGLVLVRPVKSGASRQSSAAVGAGPGASLWGAPPTAPWRSSSY